MNTRWTRPIVIVLGVLAFTFASVPMKTAHAATEEELQERFKNRLGDVRDAKAAGTIGETFEGYVDAVDGKALEEKLKKVVDEENADRRELYKLIAEKEKTTDAKVAERNAARNFQKARSGEFLRDRDGKWKKKK